jgi:adhesin/invasin
VQNVWITFSVATGPTFSPAPTADGTNDGSQCRSNPNGECSVRLRSAIPGDFLVSEIAPIATIPIDPKNATFCDPTSDPNCHSYVPNETTSTFVIDPDNQPANGVSEDGVAITLFDKNLHVVPNARVFLTVGSGARLTSTFCDTDANGVCLDDTNHKTGVTSLVAGGYTVTATPQMPNPWDKNAVAHFCDWTNTTATDCEPPPVTKNSTLVVTKDRQLADGKAQDMVRVTLASEDNRPVKNARVAFDVQPGARLVNIVCITGDGTNGTAGACDDGITSKVAGQYKVSVTEPIPTTPPEVTVTFITGGTVIPDCTAVPNRAPPGQMVTVTCNGGTPGDKVVIPGTSCSPATLSSTGDLTCTGNSSDMGNNPPIVVTNPDTGTNTGVLDFQVIDDNKGPPAPFPPPVPNCVANPNPAMYSQTVTLTCTNGVPADIVRIAGTDCNPATTPPTGVLSCQGIAGVVGSNPVVTVTDPSTGLSNSSIVPLVVYSITNPPLPDCVASPNPAKPGQQVTITCDNGEPGTEVTVPGTDCTATAIPASGSFTCKGDAGDIGNNPPIKVIDPDTGGESDGVIPLEVNPTTNPPLPNCTADPREALSSDQVTATCNGGKPGTNITIPGTDCTASVVPSSGTVICKGIAGDMGNNPPVIVVDPGTGGKSTGVLPLDIISKPPYPKLPDCVADPNPVAPGQPVTISCQNGQPGTDVTIPNTDCKATPVPGSGVLICKAPDSTTLGNNPPLIVTDPVTDLTTEGTVPLVVAPVPTPSSELSVLNIMDDNRPADGVAQDTAEVLLLDTNGNPIANTVVTFSAASGATLVNETCRTSAYGGCLVGLTAIVPGDYAVKVIAPVKLGPVQATFVGEISQAYSTLFMDVNNQPANGVSEDRAQVTLRDRNNNPVGGETVTFSVASGALFTSDGQLNAVKRATPGAPTPVTPSAQVTCMTDKQGMCEVGLTSSVPGSYDVSTTAPVTLGPVRALFGQPIPGAPDAAHSSLVISVDGATANGLSQDIATVTLHDASDMAVPNAVVAFTVDAGVATGASATLVDVACQTDADGICAVGLTSTTADQYGVTAKAGTLTLGPKTATFIAVCTATVTTSCGPAAPDAGKSKIEVLPPNNAPADGNTPDIVQVTLHDANDQPVSSVQVTLRSGVGSVGSTLSSTTCLTDASGICTVGVTSKAPGAYLVETTAPIAMGPVAARFRAAPPSEGAAIPTPALDPRVLFGLMALLAMVALRTMRRGMR